MPRKSTVAPAICIIEPTITSNNTEKPEVVKKKKPESACKRNCKKVARTLFYIFALTAVGLAFNYFVERFTNYR